MNTDIDGFSPMTTGYDENVFHVDDLKEDKLLVPAASVNIPIKRPTTRKKAGCSLSLNELNSEIATIFRKMTDSNRERNHSMAASYKSILDVLIITRNSVLDSIKFPNESDYGEREL